MVPEGGSAKLVCKSRGFPKPKITWKREDGREIIARNGPHGKTKCKFIFTIVFSPTLDNVSCPVTQLNFLKIYYSTQRGRRNFVALENNQIGDGRLSLHRIEWSSPKRFEAAEGASSL